MIGRLSLALLLAAVIGSAGPSTAAARPAASAAHVRLVALLADNTLVIHPLGGGDGVTVRLGAMRRGAVPASHAVLPGRLRGHGVVFVLVNDPNGSRVVAVDVATADIVTSFELPAAQRYNGTALLARRHVLYAFGNEPSGRAIAVRLDLASGGTRVTRLSRRAWVFGGAVDSRERFVVLSYHGPRSTGADVVPLVPGGPSCVTGPTRFEGCLEVHGDVALVGGLVAGTLGGGGVRLLALDGRIERTIAIPLPGNHFVSLAAGSESPAVLPGSCDYGGGIATVDLATGEVRVVAPAPVRNREGDFGGAAACGDRAAIGPDSLVAVAQPYLPVPQPDFGGKIVIWRNWRVVERIRVYPDPVDMALVRTS